MLGKKLSFAVIVIISSLLLVSQTAAQSVYNVIVPSTNGKPAGYYTIPRVLLQPNDTVTIQYTGGIVDFTAVGKSCAVEEAYLVDANGMSQDFLWDWGNILCYINELRHEVPSDPLPTQPHAGLFLPAQPGAPLQFIGRNTKTFTFTGTSPAYLRLGVNDVVWLNNGGQFDVRVTVTRRSFEFSTATSSIDENGGNAVITVTRSDSAAASSVHYATSNGTATAGQDYTAVSGTLNFAIGETSKTFNVPITNDAAAESNETVNLTLSAPSNGFILGVNKTAVLTINDSDTLNNNSAFVSQNVPGQMYAGIHYHVMTAFKNTGTTTWAAGTYGLSSQNPLDNTTWGFNRVNLQSAVAPGATAFIGFDITAPSTPGTYNFQWRTWQLGVEHFGAFSQNLQIEVVPRPIATITDSSIIEGDSGQKDLSFIISLDTPMIEQGWVDVATANGTAIAGQDYVTRSGRWLFERDQQSVNIKIPIIGDTAFEPTESFFLNLTPGYAILLGNDQGKAVIRDNEPTKIADLDRDGKSDFWLFRPSNGIWYGLSSRNNYSFTAVQFGANGDIPVSGDYDGDGYPDYAVWRPSTGVWYVYRTSDGQVTSFQFGISTDIPVQGDFDGDGKCDFAVFRRSTGIWYIRYSLLNDFQIQQFGLNGDVPVKGDFDGDGRTDLAVFRPSNGTWYILQSSNDQLIAMPFGSSGDQAVPADFDHDGKADIAVWRPSTGVWYYLKSSLNNTGFVEFKFGLNNDIPTPGDFDGDGKNDFSVFRPSAGMWYSWQSLTNSLAARQFGINGDIPIANRWVH
ncbi:MAG: VCBS repeat-containing protein [Chloracidobacterium sp.]|nr:VCBS repeat-containing protein [Chloracidobacterium sp.]